MIGEVTPGTPSTQASATCAGLAPSRSATVRTRVQDRVVLLRAEAQRVLVGVGARPDGGRTVARLAAGEKAAAPAGSRA